MKKQDLITALETVKPGLANKENLEQSTSFAFIDGRVFTYNDEISISHPVEGLDITGAIKAEELYAILKKLKQEEIDITVTDTEILLKAGKVKVGLVLQSEITLPLTEVGEIKRWKTLREGFLKAMQLAMFSCSTQDSTPKLTCVHVNHEIIEGSDGFRLHRTTLPEPVPVETFLIPAASVATVLKFAPNKITLTPGWVHFKSDTTGAILSCRTFADKYPDTSNIITVKKGKNITFPKTIANILDRASVFGKHGTSVTDEEVHVVLEGNRIKISADNDVGHITEEANISYEGNKIEFNIMPSLLKGILKDITTCVYTGKILKFEGEGWIFITLLKA